MRLTSFRRSGIALAGLAAAALTLSACSSPAATDSGDEAKASYKIGVSQFVQHPALDAATAGFKQAFDDAGVKVEWDDQNANGDQATAVTIAQNFASSDLDLVLAVATPAAQTAAQAITDKPILFTAVTDAVEGQLVESNEKPGGNVTGTSDLAPFDEQLALLKEVAPGAKKVGIVYASGEVNSQVQVDAVTEAAGPLGLEVVTKTVTTANDIAAATEALGDVDAIYVPTDNMVVAGIASLVQVAEDKQIPVIGAEAGTVEGGAVITLGIDYTKLGYQTGEMALKVLEGADPATMPVEVSNEFAYVVNEDAAKRMGATIPEAILAEAEKVE
ncbi:putative ABC transport system substrate-binding protein [Leucobacter komagatae]|uniref:Putative ABC transport system substrate-binding protein n=1 Tax=Leucobacter komagatae TaxID=55969 RepID=A0A542Y7S5_9MICO|nr:ABC transporter substrate-binding protein [Leucobacter komagatae]TQL44126.1 putative ABC transport system substrate-binding protein [Leucobacter komagatae]